MDQKEFIEEHKKIVIENDLWFEDNCDLWSCVTGMIYHRNSDDEPILHITGIYYDLDGGGIMGDDLQGYIDLLKKELHDITHEIDKKR